MCDGWSGRTLRGDALGPRPRRRAESRERERSEPRTASAARRAPDEGPRMQFGTIEQAIADIRAGKFVVVADDEDRENEGDLVCAAQLVTPEMINFMLRAKGMICL